MESLKQSENGGMKTITIDLKCGSTPRFVKS